MITSSIIDARKSQWKQRKLYWKSQGVQSHLGREDTHFKLSELHKNNKYSIFDSALTEWVYSWFTKEGDFIYDPFCGGSVRGIVAKKMGRDYVGVDIREEQLEENRNQAKTLNLDIQYRTPQEDNNKYDFILTCPPYWNLEKYSDLPNDLSNMKEDKFWVEYERILHESVSKLKPNRFMAMVVGDVRRRGDLKQPNGSYILLPQRTIDILSKVGVFLYNDVIYINNGNVVTAKKQMEKFRKVGKIHQNLLIFNKGDWKSASNRLKI